MAIDKVHDTAKELQIRPDWPLSQDFKSPSLRMQILLKSCLLGAPTYDLCCDHGWIGYFALKYGISEKVSFIDLRDHLVRSVEEKFKKFFTQSYSNGFDLHYRTQDVSTLKVPDKSPCNIILAGIGSELCKKSIASVIESCAAGTRFICQTNRSVLTLTAELTELFPKLTPKDSIVFEENRKKYAVHVLDWNP